MTGVGADLAWPLLCFGPCMEHVQLFRGTVRDRDGRTLSIIPGLFCGCPHNYTRIRLFEVSIRVPDSWKLPDRILLWA